jgi:succinylarginine dihydrolase
MNTMVVGGNAIVRISLALVTLLSAVQMWAANAAEAETTQDHRAGDFMKTLVNVKANLPPVQELVVTRKLVDAMTRFRAAYKVTGRVIPNKCVIFFFFNYIQDIQIHY